jgi:amidase
MTSWLSQSYMGRRGVAKGVPGPRHELTEAKQGKYHYVYGPYAEPVLHIAPGDIVVAETKDAFEGKIKSESDSPTKLLHIPFLNPQCGPIAVDGAVKGDVLCVHIHSIKPRGRQPIGTTALIPEFGGLVATNNTALLNAPLPERVKKMEVTEQGIKFNASITLPYEPFIGTLGVSPEIEAITSLQPDYYGGNMDLPDVAPGAIVYFPVHHADAYLYLGDCHATQGDGELCGVAVEMDSTTVVQVDLIKNWNIAWPRLETEDFIMVIGSTRPMEDAARIAYRELVRWLEEDYGFDVYEAYFLLTQAGRVRLGNMVDPKYSLEPRSSNATCQHKTEKFSQLRKMMATELATMPMRQSGTTESLRLRLRPSGRYRWPPTDVPASCVLRTFDRDGKSLSRWPRQRAGFSPCR